MSSASGASRRPTRRSHTSRVGGTVEPSPVRLPKRADGTQPLRIPLTMAHPDAVLRLGVAASHNVFCEGARRRHVQTVAGGARRGSTARRSAAAAARTRSSASCE